MENLTYAETKNQTLLVTAPPSKPRKQKDPEDCYLSFIDQGTDGYGGSILVRNKPKTTKDKHFIVRTFKAEVRSHRRNKTHKSVALYRTKKEGSTRKNIAYMTCSFLELDGSTDNTIKTKEDVNTLINKNNLPMPSYVIETSKGHFHLIWTYNDPLPWTTRNESFWISQQRRKIELFKQAGFNVDVGASLNPCQNLRNPSQLQPFNFKRRCKVYIHSSYKKTSLRAIYRALNKTSIPNPRPIPANTKLRRYLRQNKTFEITLSQLAENLGTSLRTVKTQVSRAVQNGDLRIVARLGNNSEKIRRTRYESIIFIEQFPEVQLSISKDNSLPISGLLRDFKRKGTPVGRRQKTLFALGLFLKAKLGKRACIESITAELEGGAMRCHVSKREFERTLKSIMKPEYTHPFSLSKLRAWDLIEEIKHFH